MTDIRISAAPGHRLKVGSRGVVALEMSVTSTGGEDGMDLRRKEIPVPAVRPRSTLPCMHGAQSWSERKVMMPAWQNSAHRGSAV